MPASECERLVRRGPIGQRDAAECSSRCRWGRTVGCKQSRERVPHAEGILLEEPDPDPISWTATRSRGEAENTGEFAEHECAVFVGTAADVIPWRPGSS